MTAVELAAPVTTGARSRVVFWLAVALATVVLIAPALWNGFPLLQYDTGGYLARWFEGYLVPSRPGAYGLALAAAAAWRFWPVVVLQSLATIWIVWLLLRTHGLTQHVFTLPAVIVTLSAITTLPWLTAILLTDIFAGLAVLGLYLCVSAGDCVSRAERVGLVLFIAVAAATHSATYAVISILAALALAAVVIAARRDLLRGALHGIAAALTGTALTYAANFAVSGHVAWTPGGYSILFGRLLQDGIVSRYLNDRCPERALKLCPFRRDLPHDADSFLWGGSVFDRLGRFAGLREEMRSIVLGSLSAYPGEQVRTAAVATARQLVRVRSGEGVNDQMWHTYGIIERYTPALTPQVRAARQQRGEVSFDTLNPIHEPVALMSIVLLGGLLCAGWRRPNLPVPKALIATVGLAILANAFVCGALANPHDRYGARMAWLATLAVLVAVLSMMRLRQRTPTAAAEMAPQPDRQTLHTDEIAANRGGT